jgi:hypothetical protein
MPLRPFARVADLREGLILRHVASGDAYVMAGWAHWPRSAVALRHIALCNPSEWLVAAVWPGWRRLERMALLYPGAVVRHRGSGNEYVVVAPTDDPEVVSGVSHRLLTDPSEWLIYDPEPDEFATAPGDA